MPWTPCSGSHPAYIFLKQLGEQMSAAGSAGALKGSWFKTSWLSFHRVECLSSDTGATKRAIVHTMLMLIAADMTAVEGSSGGKKGSFLEELNDSFVSAPGRGCWKLEWTELFLRWWIQN